MAILLDSYDYTNKDTQDIFISGGGYVEGAGQAFTFDKSTAIASIKFYLRRQAYVDGANSYARIYACTGTPGVDGKPTGAALFSSTVRNVNTISTVEGWEEWVFTNAGVSPGNYCIVLEIPTGGSLNNYITIGYDNSSPTHGGNYCHAASLPTWSAVGTGCLCFQLYGGYPRTVCTMIM